MGLWCESGRTGDARLPVSPEVWSVMCKQALWDRRCRGPIVAAGEQYPGPLLLFREAEGVHVGGAGLA